VFATRPVGFADSATALEPDPALAGLVGMFVPYETVVPYWK
jgi:hypothetical protein